MGWVEERGRKRDGRAYGDQLQEAERVVTGLLAHADDVVLPYSGVHQRAAALLARHGAAGTRCTQRLLSSVYLTPLDLDSAPCRQWRHRRAHRMPNEGPFF